jgi:hypothetical protein
MDPNEILRELRRWAKAMSTGNHAGPTPSLREMSMADLFESLDEWLTKGGFMPDAWDTAYSSKEAKEW